MNSLFTHVRIMNLPNPRQILLKILIERFILYFHRANAINYIGKMLDVGYFMSSSKPIILLQKQARDPYCAPVHQLKRLHQSITLIIRMEVTSFGSFVKERLSELSIYWMSDHFRPHINTVLEFVLDCPVWIWACRPGHTFSTLYGLPRTHTVKQNPWW